MRHLALALMLLLAVPAAAQRTQPLDGVYAGFRTHECRAGGRLGRERVTMQVAAGRATLPAMLGGGVINYLCSAIAVALLPPGPLAPMVGVAIGSIAGMSVNFISSKLLVFR